MSEVLELGPERRDPTWPRAKLVREDDGRIMCRCPYACAATYERCEFANSAHIAPSGSPDE